MKDAAQGCEEGNMILYGYSIGYQFSNENKEIHLFAKYEDKVVYGFKLPCKNNTEAYSIYLDWSNYLYNMQDVFFFEEIGVLR